MAGTVNLPTPQDKDKNFALIGVQGTAGTADTGGTSVTMPISVDPTTGGIHTVALGASTVSISGGTINAGTVTVGAINSIGTLGTLQLGTVTLTNPTGTTVQFDNGTVDLLKAGTISMINAGTISAITAAAQNIKGDYSVGTNVNSLFIYTGPGVLSGTTWVGHKGSNGTAYTQEAQGTLAMLNAGTITTIPNIPGGTLGLVTRVGNVGTIEVGTVTLTNPTGTTVQFNNGTIDLIKAGTITTLPNTPGGTLGLVTTVSNLTSGSVRMTVGTLTVMPNVPGGTLGLVTTVSNLTNGSIAVTAGTITHGTIDAGTVRINPSPTIVSNTYGTTTTGTIGTLVAAPSAGSAIIVTGLDVNVQSGTAEPCVSWGLAANGNQVLSRGNYVAGGGISKNMVSPVSGSATGTALTFNVLSGSGTVSYCVSYYIAVP